MQNILLDALQKMLYDYKTKMVSWSKMEKESKEKKRELILKVAEKIFAKHGYKKTSVDEIASEARVSKGAIYLYFKSKEEIFETLVKRHVERLWRAIKAAADGQSDPREKIRKATLAKVKYLQKLATLKGITKKLFDEVKSIIESEMRKLEEKEVELLTQILLEGERKNLFVKIPEVRLVAYALVKTFGELNIPWIFAKKRVDTRKKVDILMGLLFEGIEARS